MSALEPRGRGSLRVSDAERDRCAAALREHYADGRLDDGELEERLSAATRAQTQRDLRAVVRDLPRPRRSSPLGRAAVRTHAVAFTLVNGGLVGIWAATGEGTFWPGMLLAPWSAGLAAHVLARRAALAARRRLRP